MSNKQTDFVIQPGQHLSGTIVVPGDKSISHRALMLGAIAEGTTVIDGFLEAKDSLATLQALEDLGVKIDHLNPGEVRVHGNGPYGLSAPTNALECGNSGTAMRMLTGILSAQPFDATLTGDESLLKRPMARVAEPLNLMGASVSLEGDDTGPIHIKGSKSLHAIRYELPIASAQVKSSILLAGLYAQGETDITEPAPTRDHTERMLRAFGCTLKTSGNRIRLEGPQTLKATDINIPGDISAAAFFMIAATITPNSDVLLEQVGMNPYRIGILNILRMMGANIEIGTEYYLGEEPVADIRVQSAELRGIDIPLDQVAIAIDEFPALFIAAACAKGTTTLRGAKELRVKETDRILAMSQNLTALGIENEPLPDGIVIQGGKFTGGRVKSYGDHRVAMAFSIAGSVAGSLVTIEDCSYVGTSCPNFVALAQSIGIQIKEHVGDIHVS